jgi:hypothetical protein
MRRSNKNVFSEGFRVLLGALLFIAAFYVVVSLSGCSTFRPPYDLGTEYMRRIDLKVEAFQGDSKKPQVFEGRGIISVPVASHYYIHGTVKGEADFLLWNTCTGQEMKERQGDEFSQAFVPNDIELEMCPTIEIRTLEKNKGRNGGALIVIDDPRAWQLPASVLCNRKEIPPGAGTTACHAKQNVIQRISFPVPVFARAAPESAPGCANVFPENMDFQEVIFKMPSEWCEIGFMEAGEPFRAHRLILYPYSDVMVTGEKE